MAINWRERLSRRISSAAAFFSFWEHSFIFLQQVGFSVVFPGEGRKAIRLIASKTAVMPKRVQFFFLMLAGFVMGRK